MSAKRRAEAFRERFIEPDYFMIVAEDSVGRLLGFADYGPNRHAEFQHESELYAIYVRPGHEGRGIGRRLFVSGATELQVRHRPRLILCALTINRNRGFYERLDGREVGRGALMLGDQEHEVVYYGWDKLPRIV